MSKILNEQTTLVTVRLKFRQKIIYGEKERKKEHKNNHTSYNNSVICRGFYTISLFCMFCVVSDQSQYSFRNFLIE